jgi:hypothetical protein
MLKKQYRTFYVTSKTRFYIHKIAYDAVLLMEPTTWRRRTEVQSCGALAATHFALFASNCFLNRLRAEQKAMTTCHDVKVKPLPSLAGACSDHNVWYTKSRLSVGFFSLDFTTHLV